MAARAQDAFRASRRSLETGIIRTGALCPRHVLWSKLSLLRTPGPYLALQALIPVRNWWRISPKEVGREVPFM